MNRRQWILFGLGAGMGAPLALLSGCARATGADGPVDIKWGRETCAHCGMVLSDRRFAAQARGSRVVDHWVFDDVGCAAAWLDTRPAPEQALLRLWVAGIDSPGEGVQWLDARTAHYLEGRMSPMGYNFGATGATQPGAIAFAALRERVRARRTRGP